MKIEDVNNYIAELKFKGHNSNDIIYTLAHLHIQDEITIEELQLLIKTFGVNLSKKFINANKKKRIKLIMKNKILDEKIKEENLIVWDE